MTIKSKSFREDINGLRAWAVVSVILFHFGITGFSGGFVGVDIFFVISGFLMTGIIVGGLEKSANHANAPAFSVIDFYLSRARRIIPALLALCAFVMIAGWFFLSALEYKALGTDTISALSFLSNVKFFFEAGYFDAKSHDKALLHTWSLSVEWQFYLILPLLLLATWKIRPNRNALVVMIAVVFTLSLLLCIAISPSMATAAFYLLPTRAWEMLAGGLVYLLANRLQLSSVQQKMMELLGFALIIGSITLFNGSSNWPGWRALVPVLGAMLVITAARQGSLWTGNRLAQWLGDCSYSLYLWHWPFVVALVYLHKQYTPEAIAAGLALSVILGWLSFKLIENPSRSTLTRLPKWTGAGALAVVMVMIMLPSQWIRMQQGMPERMSAHINDVFNEALNINPRGKECMVAGRHPVPECTYGSGNTTGIIVIGDSHAGAVVRAVERALPDLHHNVLDWTRIGCPTIAGLKEVKNPNGECGKFVSYAVEKNKTLDHTIPLVIINRTSSILFGPNDIDRDGTALVPSTYLTSPHSSRDSAFLQEMRNGFVETACEFAKTRPVYMVRPIPELIVDVPKTMGHALMQGQSGQVSISMEEYKQRHAYAWETQNIAAQRCGIKLLDPTPYLCRDGRCWGDKNGLPLYYDDNHLSERGGDQLIPMFRQIFTDLAKPAPLSSVMANVSANRTDQ